MSHNQTKMRVLRTDIEHSEISWLKVERKFAYFVNCYEAEIKAEFGTYIRIDAYMETIAIAIKQEDGFMQEIATINLHRVTSINRFIGLDMISLY